MFTRRKAHPPTNQVVKGSPLLRSSTTSPPLMVSKLNPAPIRIIAYSLVLVSSPQQPSLKISAKLAVVSNSSSGMRLLHQGVRIGSPRLRNQIIQTNSSPKDEIDTPSPRKLKKRGRENLPTNSKSKVDPIRRIWPTNPTEEAKNLKLVVMFLQRFFDALAMIDVCWTMIAIFEVARSLLTSMHLFNRSSPYFLQSFVHPGVVMVSNKLTGEKNWYTWSNAMKFSLVSRAKLGFIGGSIKKPSNSLEREAWNTVNGLVLSWIINS